MNVTLKDNVLIVNFNGNKKMMNDLLDPLSNAYEGVLVNRQGHNFPSEFIVKGHKLYEYKMKCKYVIGVLNTKSLGHELLHAKFFIDSKYRESIENEWKGLKEQTRVKITDFLKRLGYSDKVIIDEYQAYRYTEKPNFFGFKIE